ncbi:MAG: high-affinity nickel-transport family protein [Deltaproteobacteria bacterium]|nr:high-affinity nickel-transport family protein [Deltaproteobacteria bacterium]
MPHVLGPLGPILLGLTLGMRHATDPDHVIAVTAILSRERRFFSAIRIGLVWGFGHSATVLAVGMAIIFFKLKMPARLGLTLEFAVAVVLILLGARAAKESLALLAKKLCISSSKEATIVVHSHSHTHDVRGLTHTHEHVHIHSAPGSENLASHDHLISPGIPETMSGRSIGRAFVVGLVHGMAGSAAIALLVTAAIPSPWLASIYMIIFCVGVMIGMILVTAAVGGPFVMLAERLAGTHQRITRAAGWLSFGFGVFLAYQIGVVEQLFGPTPHWFPH